MFFFSWVFFLRTLDCLVSNCSWRNSRFIGIKFTLLPLLEHKEKSMRTCMDLNICKVVKLSDLPVFRRGNHWETIISKSIAVSYPGNFIIHIGIRIKQFRTLRIGQLRLDAKSPC